MDFIKPVNDNFTISSYFDEGFDLSSIFGGVGNYGLDFNTTPYAEVVAAEDGYVIGNVIIARDMVMKFSFCTIMD